MYKQLIEIKKPAFITLAFSSEIKSFSVLNKNGRVFYTREFTEPLNFDQFNINESGPYTVISDAKVKGIKFERIKEHARIPLPKKVWNFNRPVSFVWKNVNQSPACIIPKECVIYLNSMMRDFPIGVCNFIIEHEKGHRFYPSEDHCDLYAINNILKKGGNLYMCWYALEKILKRSPAKVQRLKDFVRNIQKIDYGRK